MTLVIISSTSPNAILFQAEYLFLTGQGKKAEQQLEYGLKESEDTFSLHSHIKARLSAMQKARAQKF